MVMVDSYTYISLKDLLPEAAPPIMAANYDRKDSWREIPIKDPLLQHAAWAYLQPRQCEADGRSCAAKLKDMCCGLVECFGGLLDEVVCRTMKRLFSDDENVDDDDDAVKVD